MNEAIITYTFHLSRCWERFTSHKPEELVKDVAFFCENLPEYADNVRIHWQ